MKKYFGFLICLILSLILLGLSLVTDTISCDKKNGACKFTSKIRYLNTKLNEEEFSIENLANTYCEKQIQPSKKGPKSYYILKVDINGRAYNISSYKKFKDCRQSRKAINDQMKDSTTDTVNVDSKMGFINTFGIMFAVITFLVGLIILKEPPAEDEDLEDEDI